MSSLTPVHGPTKDVIRLLADWLADPDAAPLLIETSGSTGQPKRVRLSRRALLASAEATHERLGGPDRWTLAVPVNFVAGVQVVLRSLLAGHRPDTELTGHGYVSLVPTQLHRLLDNDAETLARYRAVLVGGGPVPPPLRERAAAAGVRVVASYGMSETCGGCVYDGVPLSGVDVRIGDEDRIELSGPTLFDGYDGDAVGTARVLRDGWFRTDDVGAWDGHRLRVWGRVDDMVNTGGVKVPAGVVAARLREHPRINAAEVLGVPDPEWGERLVAFAVGEVELAELRDWVAERHPRTWAPRQLVSLDAIPMTERGKVDRARLRELA